MRSKPKGASLKKDDPCENELNQLIEKRRILITCGTGGVGKTSLSAALALRAALLGRRTLVITIDPARRLASALGLKGSDALSIYHRPVDLTEAYNKVGPVKIPPGGQWWGLMPSPKKSFEELIRELAPSAQVAQSLLRNPIVQTLSQEFSGAHAYLALEHLYQATQATLLSQDGTQVQAYETIILDTPPSRHVMEFIDAPRLLNHFLDERLIKWLVAPISAPTSGLQNFFKSATKNTFLKATQLLERLTGKHFFANLMEFATGLIEIQIKLSKNLAHVDSLLQSNEVGFLLVSSPQNLFLDEIAHFINSMKERNLNLDGTLLNRTVAHLSITPDQDRPISPEQQELLRGLLLLEKRAVQYLNKQPSKSTHLRFPELSRDIHGLQDLYWLGQAGLPLSMNDYKLS